MKKRYGQMIFVSIFLAFFFGCSQETGEKGAVLSRINDYELTLNEFERQLTAELELDKTFKLTREAKVHFLEDLIRKELLLQEAKRRKLDRREAFVQAMERYWESTLIRDLIEVKGKEIEEKTYVSQEEIKDRYHQLTNRDPSLPPLDQVEEKLKRELTEKKKSRSLKEWISGLRERADVQIRDDLL